ncbi:MAG: DUF72 domain-containing protein [Aigarchaeota archaeon]|nr:DUF72 domain-containing protein [Aigarchaeota archaeon]MCS7126859.1 DUF72 domain-containing protein [Candidatus Calditenuaceae archaeon]MCX8203453.1 DUF72 domain-containing protein [Nitrososphaeria archaeon]MDW8043036.1 DUF72 domain-containing protein [Nitrososphaerota archaeon]
MRAIIGCCGFPVARNRYYKMLGAVEVQTTFYRVVRRSTLERWRREAPEGFVFALKAFQGVTHPKDSPTWKRSNVRPKDGHGLLRPTEEVRESWKVTLDACRALSAKAVVVQTPPAFRDTPENVANAIRFFGSIERDEAVVGFEPRGWSQESVRRVCEETDVTHVTDLFAAMPVALSSRSIAYFRLHGSPPGKRMYSYTYTDDDLRALAELLREVEAKEVYLMFNNVTMFDDALRFLRLLQSTG